MKSVLASFTALMFAGTANAQLGGNGISGNKANLLYSSPSTFTSPVTQRAPLKTDDTTAGYTTSSLWNGPSGLYIATQVTAGAATWTPQPTTGLPCDVGDSANLSVCLGMRLLKAGYAGKAINVTRASDSTTLDIGLLANGALDEATLWQFCAGTTCTLDKWYDQSGNQMAASAAVSGVGSGYAASGTLTLSGATCLVTPTWTFTASGGSLTGVTQAKAGICSVVPANPASVTGGSGSSGTLTVTWANQNYSQATAANQPAITQWNRTGNSPSVVFNNILDTSATTIFFTAPSGISQAVLAANNAAGIVLFGNGALESRNNGYFSFAAGGGTTLGLSNLYLSASCTQGATAGGCLSPTLGGSATQVYANSWMNSPSLLAFVSGASASKIYIGQDIVNSSATTPSGAAIISGKLGENNTTTGTFELGAYIVYNDATSAANMATVDQSLNIAFGTYPQVEDVIVMDGDSIGQGYNGTTASVFNNETPIALAGRLLLPYSAKYYNFAVFGNQFVTRIANYPYGPATAYNSLAKNNIMIEQAATNDINAGTSAGTTYASLTTMVGLAHTTGFKVVCRTVIARNNAFDTVRLAYNALVRTNAAACDAISDPGNDAIMGQFSNATNSTYFVDGTHPTNLGYQIIANYDAAAIKSLLH